jgi:1,5-anhydro-D-fructose reductase (1,5-anhydro-D-mannitol-forming)
VEAFRAAGLPLFVAYYRRALPRFKKARELVESDALGTITSVSYRFCGPYHRDLPQGLYHGIDPAALPWRLDAAHAGGGLFLDLGCHALDILDFILGPLEQVTGFAANRGTPIAVEDNVVMSFRTASGVPGTAQWNFAAPLRPDDIAITGDTAELRLSTFGDEPLALYRGSDVEHIALPNPTHIQEPLIQTIVDALSATGTCPSTGDSAARTSKVMDDVLKSYYGTRADDFWRRPETWPGKRT